LSGIVTTWLRYSQLSVSAALHLYLHSDDLPFTEVMVDYPSTAKFLTEEQRSFVIQKRRGSFNVTSSLPPLMMTVHTGRDTVQDQDDGQHAARQVWEAFTDWQV
jgi:hypothetical protein